MTGTWDVRLISSSYTSNDREEPYIELFGKTREHKSITVAVFGFRTYFYIVDPTASVEESLASDRKEVFSLEHVKLFYKGKDHDTLKVTLRRPWMLATYRKKYMSRFKILAGDISYNDRYMYDTDMGACIRVTGEETDLGYATDLTVKLQSFENIDSFDPGLRYFSFDIENSIEDQHIYCICARIEENGEYSTPDPLYGDEKDIILGFSDLIQRIDPDVITGYNIDNYDIRKIKERADALRLKGAMKWGRDCRPSRGDGRPSPKSSKEGEPRLFNERFWRVKGRLIVDAWWAAKRELRPKQETLNAVSLLVLGERKLDVDPKHMDEEWRNNREKVLEYCVQDANLALRILLAIGNVRKGMDLAAVSKLPIEDALVSGTSTLADSLLIRAADRNGVGVPMNGARSAREDQIEGGYVHVMRPGLYHWVCVLDFKSMYPSLIIANNICFTTFCDDGEIAAPSGARYANPERKRGLLPKILSDLMAQRDDIKKRMGTVRDPSEYSYLNGLQTAVKVVMNTFYGVFASSFYRFTDKSIGASITAFARSTIKDIIRQLESDGHPVIYGDTDSVFVLSPYHDLESAVGFGNEQAARFSEGARVLEFEKLLEPLFSHGVKKRYVGKIVWPEKQDGLLVRGYEIRRSDSFDLQSRMLTELFEKILEEDDEGALALARDTIHRTVNGKVDPGDLVISRTCRGLDAYENPERMANVLCAKKLIEMGYTFIPGMKVSWVVTDASSSPQKVEPYISGMPFKGSPDYKYYAGRLAQMASRITEVFGWDENDLMARSRHTTLIDGDFISAKKKPAGIQKASPVRREGKSPERPKKNVSLDDFS